MKYCVCFIRIYRFMLNDIIYLFFCRIFDQQNDGDCVKTFFRNELHHVRTFYQGILCDLYNLDSKKLRTQYSTRTHHIDINRFPFLHSNGALFKKKNICLFLNVAWRSFKILTIAQHYDIIITVMSKCLCLTRQDYFHTVKNNLKISNCTRCF